MSKRRLRHIGKGFTLIELLVVISVIALLLSIIVPSLQKAKEAARLVVCGTNMKQMGLASTIYTTDFNGWLLPAISQADEVQNASTGIAVNWGQLYELGYFDFNLWICPADRNFDRPERASRKPTTSNWGETDLGALFSSYIYLSRVDLVYDKREISPPPLQSASVRYFKSANLKTKTYTEGEPLATGPVSKRIPSKLGIGCDSYWVIGVAGTEACYSDYAHKNIYNVIFADGHVGRYKDRDETIKNFGARSSPHWHDAIWYILDNQGD